MKEVKQTKSKQINKLNWWLHLIIILLLSITMVASALGIYAWARYASFFSGDTTAQVAKWYFNLKTGETTINDSTRVLMAMTRTDDRSYVEEGKLAPGTYGVLPIIVDTTGTETDLKYDLTITINNCPKNAVFETQTASATIISETGDGTDESPRVRTIKISKYIPYGSVGEHNETVTWDWSYQTGTGNEITTNDNIDTRDAGKEVTVSITAVGTEMLSRPVSMSTITDNNSNTIINGDTITLKMGDPPAILSYSLKTEKVAYTSEDSSIATASSDGKINPVSPGKTTVTITGEDSNESILVNVKVKPKIEVHEGDTIQYSPSGTYEWNKALARSNTSGIITLSSESGQAYNLTTWKVLSVDDSGNFEMVPTRPTTGAIGFQGQHGYNNAVYLLNAACSALYSGPDGSGITARSINEEDLVKAGGSAWTEYITTTSYGYTPSNPYSRARSYYPSIYGQEKKSVIAGQEAESGLGQSEQNVLVGNTSYGATYGYLGAASIQPYTTSYSTSNYNKTAELLGDTYKDILLPQGQSASYWVASRGVNAYSDSCDYVLFRIAGGSLSTVFMFNSGTGTQNGEYSGKLFPVVSLNADVLETTETAGTYVVNLD